MEEAVRAVFASLERFNYVGAQEILKQKIITLAGSFQAQNILPLLQSFVQCESLLYSLTFLDAKNAKKEASATPLWAQYTHLIADSQRLEGLHGGSLESELLSSLLKDWSAYCQIRLDLLQVYVGLANSLASFPVLEEHISLLSRTLDRLTALFRSPPFSRLKTHLSVELRVLHGLISAQNFLYAFNFKDSLATMFHLKAEIDVWKRNSEQVIRKIPLFSWLIRFYLTLQAKVPLYFFKVLKKHEEEIGDIRNLASKNDIDLLCSLDSFTAKNELITLSLVLNASGLASAGGVFSLGFSFVPPSDAAPASPSSSPSASRPALTGLSSWPAIFSLPAPEPPAQHWPNVVSILMDQSTQAYFAKYPTSPFYLADKRLRCSYFATQVFPLFIFSLSLSQKMLNR